MAGHSSAADRALRLAAYLHHNAARPHTLETIVHDLPAYGPLPLDGDGRVAHGPAWETARRQLRRDLHELRECFGIVVDYDQDRSVWVLQPPFLTPKERQAILAAAAAVDVDLGEDPPLGELGAGVDEQQRGIVVQVHDAVVVLCEAIRTRTPVTFGYRGRRRTLDPYAVGRWQHHWYTIGHEHEAGERRRYRLDRIEHDGGSVATAGPPGSYMVPDDFAARDLLALDPNDWGTDPPVEARVHVDLDHVHTLQREFGGQVETRDDDHAVVVIGVRHYRAFRDRLLAFRDHARVVGPPELVAFVRDHLAAVAASTGAA